MGDGRAVALQYRYPPMSSAAAYLKKIAAVYASGDATELTYRPALQALLEQAGGGAVTAVHEPRRTECGAPDFIVLRNGAPIGHVECKGIGANLGRAARSEQLRRYLDALPNLLLTDYLSFRWYHDGSLRLEAHLARCAADGKLRGEKNGAAELEKLLGEFFSADALTVAAATELAGRMAAQARLLYGGIVRILQGDEKQHGNLGGLLDDYRKALIPQLSVEQFADMQAQTAAYGLFAARCRHRPEAGRFTRKDAVFIETNPFLHEVFVRIAGPKMDGRISWIADNLAELLGRADMRSVLEDFGGGDREQDPVIHFYENFLKAYDPKLREMRGVYYTPAPVVSWIVRSIDFLLREKFNLADGLADAGRFGFCPGPGAETEEAHRVLILDPAAGTGTFLCGVIDRVYRTVCDQGVGNGWSDYVREHLLPRLFGFEFLMAPYAICYLKMEMKLAETGIDAAAAVKDRRLNVYLTNTLEKSEETVAGPVFAHEIVREANEAHAVKQKKPVMVVLGNPPYSGHTANKGEWIKKLLHGSDDGRAVADYFSVDGAPLGERNPKWLNDDYVRFMRFAHWRIAQTGEGVLGFITNHAWIDNPTFRGMRQSLLEDFDEIYILDLHGNSRKKERAPDGGKDENVFDIQQGVAVGLFIKRRGGDGARPARVFHADLWGRRREKFGLLEDSDVDSTAWSELAPDAPDYLFVSRDVSLAEEYEKGWKVTEIFPHGGVGITTARDRMAVDFVRAPLLGRASMFRDSRESDRDLCDSLQIPMKKGWDVAKARQILQEEERLGDFVNPVLYRPFDRRLIFYHDALVWRTVKKVMCHMLAGKNIGLCIGRAGHVVGSEEWNLVHIADSPTDINLFRRGGNYLCPLYLYPENGSPNGSLDNSRKLNIAPKFMAAVEEALGAKPRPEEVFHYIYAVLHSPEYRRRYRDFLKMDFPRIPLPGNAALFRQLAAEGETLARHHLMRDTGARADKPRFTGKGGCMVEKVRYAGNKVHINDRQCYSPVAEPIWNHVIGGYRPAQKWLQDRKGRELKYEDILHYMDICAVLAETLRAMRRIDQAAAKHGGWGG